MPVEYFQIELANSQKAYFAGQVVSGVVRLVITERPELIKGVLVKVQGKAKTDWYLSSNGRSSNHFSERETLIDQTNHLVGYDQKGRNVRLDEGDHEFPFNFPLPASLPCSLDHEYGQIKYELEATVTMNSKSNHTSKVPFGVTKIIDLNFHHDARMEGHVASEKTVGCLCCRSGPIGFQFKTPRTGFVPGERVPFEFHMFNQSNRRVKHTSIAIMQELKFMGDMDHSKTEKVQILCIRGPKLESRESDWIVNSETSPLRIPLIPPTHRDGCDIIFITYFLKIKMEAKDSPALKECLPIIIGSIPIRNDSSCSCEY